MVDFSSMNVRDYFLSIKEGQTAGTVYNYDALMEIEKKDKNRKSIIRFLKLEKRNTEEVAPAEEVSQEEVQEDPEEAVLTYTEDLSPSPCRFPVKAVDGQGNAYCTIHHSLLCIECVQTGVKVNGKLVLKTRCRKICKAHDHSKQVQFTKHGKPKNEDFVAVEGVSLEEFDNA